MSWDTAPPSLPVHPTSPPAPHRGVRPGTPGIRRLLPEDAVVLLQPGQALQHLAHVLQVPQPLPRHRQHQLRHSLRANGGLRSYRADEPPKLQLSPSTARTDPSGSSTLGSSGSRGSHAGSAGRSAALTLRRPNWRGQRPGPRCLLLRCAACTSFLLAERLRDGRGGSVPGSSPGGFFSGGKPSREKLLSEPKGVGGEWSLLAISTPESSDSDLRSLPLAGGLPGEMGGGGGGPQAFIPPGGCRGLSCSRR